MPTVPKPKLRRRWRILIGAAVCMAVLFAATLARVAWDEAEPDLSDVLPRPRGDLQAQANWAQLLSACQAMGDASAAWEPPETLAAAALGERGAWGSGPSPVEVFFNHNRPREELEGLVTALEAELSALDAALALPGFEAPLPMAYETNLDPRPRAAATGLATLGRFCLGIGDPEKARRMLQRIIRLARCIDAAEGDSLYAIQNHAVRGIGLNLIPELVEALHPPEERMSALLALSEETRPSVTAFAEGFRVDLFRGLLLLDKVRDGYVMEQGRWKLIGGPFLSKPVMRLLVRPNQTRRMLAEMARLGIRQLELPVVQHDRAVYRRYPVRHESGLPHINNAAGRAVLNIGQAFPGTATVHLAAQTRISIEQAAWAALAYQRDHQKLPPDLNSLVPDYLPGVPRDYLCDEPISYDAERGVVWSPGATDFQPPERGKRYRHDIAHWLLPEPEPSTEEDANPADEAASDDLV